MNSEGALEYFNGNNYYQGAGEHSRMTPMYDDKNHQIYDVNRPAGCSWLNGIKGYMYFNHIIDPILTNPKNFIDRGGVCKAPGNDIRREILFIISRNNV